MRIGTICHSSLGGSARIAVGLCVEMAKRGHKSHLITQMEPFGNWRLHEYGVSLHLTCNRAQVSPRQLATLDARWNSQVFNQFLAQLLEIVLAERLDIVHFHYAMPFALVAAEMKTRLGEYNLLVVGTLHGTDVSVFGNNPSDRSLLANALSKIDVLTTVSHSHSRLAAEIFGLSHQPLVIPNFIDTRHFRPWTKGDTNYVDRKPIIAHVSNFRPVKNTQIMVHIFFGILNWIDAELWLIGDGPELEKVKQLIQLNGCEDKVRIFGLLEDVASALAQADLLLMTSKTESFCLSAVEAMSCGVPVLAPAVSGFLEVVKHRETGLLFPTEDPGEAIRLAVDFLSHPKRYAHMRADAIAHAHRFDKRNIVPLYESLYKTFLDSSSSNRFLLYSRADSVITS